MDPGALVTILTSYGVSRGFEFKHSQCKGHLKDEMAIRRRGVCRDFDIRVWAVNEEVAGAFG